MRRHHQPTGGGAVAGSPGGTRRSAFLRSIVTVLVTIGVASVAFLVIAELYLRVTYSEGLSFEERTGPYVRQFERDFTFNRYDGPSRGPEIVASGNGNGLHVLLQGDAIAWGQGVKDENALFTSLVRERLRFLRPNAGMAVLAEPARGIDGHLDQLVKWGDEIAPDIIIYQWSLNPIERDNALRAPWPLVAFAKDRSYLWYLLDHRIGAASRAGSYADAVAKPFGDQTDTWRAFSEQFRRWAAEAHRHTPNILIVLYPHFLPAGEQLGAIHDRLRALAQANGVEVLDLREALAPLGSDWAQTFASPSDGHPNQATHARIAEALHARLQALWPDVLGESPDRAASRLRSVPKPAPKIVAARPSGKTAPYRTADGDRPPSRRSSAAGLQPPNAMSSRPS